MPEITLTSMERRISDEADARHEFWTRGQVKSLARRAYWRWMAFEGEGIDAAVAYTLTYADPTGETATNRVMAARS